MSERKVFTYKDVEEAKKYIGKTGVFTDDFRDGNEGRGRRAILSEISDGAYPFVPHDWDGPEQSNYQFFSLDPEPIEKWMPFDKEDWPSLLGRGILNKQTGFGSIITTFGNGGLGTSCDHDPDPETLLRDFTFTDGTPCGKKVTE